MSANGFTPISLYYSTTASAVPTAANLVQGELAINTADGKLYYEDSSGVVQVLATKSTGSIGGSNTQVQFNNSGSLGGSSGLTWDGSFLTTSSIKNSALTSGRVTYAGASGLLKDSANMTFDDTSLTLGGQIFLSNNNYIGFKNTSASVSASIFNDTSNFLNLYNSSNTGTIFYVNAGERLRLTNTTLYTASGVNVGIGTSNPQRTLSIANGGPTVEIDPNGGTAGPIYFNYNRSTATYITPEYWALAHNWRVSGGTSAMTLDSSGNLGLGVTPTAWQTALGTRAIQFTSGAVLGYRDTNFLLTQNAYLDSTTGGWKYLASSIPAAYYDIGSGGFGWFQAPSGTVGGTVTFTQAMTLDASGNLLVGTTSVPTTARTKGFAAKPSSSGGISIYQTDNVSDWGITATSGSIVNFYSDTGSALTYAGTISVNGIVTTYGSVSDYRLKENIVPMTGALAKVAQLKPVTYKWKLNGSDGQGFIAHELAEVVPDCVTGEKDAIDEDGKPKYQAMDTSHLVATLVSAIQELKAEVDSLKQQLNGA